MKVPKKIIKTMDGQDYLIDNPDYTKRRKPTNIKPKNKKRKK